MDLTNNKYYKKALEFIATTDLNALETGKHIIDGDNLFVNIIETTLKTPAEGHLEVHDKYIDIQVPLSRAEGYGIKPRTEAKGPEGEYNPEKDILFYSDKDWPVITMDKGQPITFDPDTAHAPMIGEGPIKKAIFKVKAI